MQVSQENSTRKEFNISHENQILKESLNQIETIHMID